MNWIIFYLARFPELQLKAQIELDSVMGRDRLPFVKDLQRYFNIFM